MGVQFNTELSHTYETGVIGGVTLAFLKLVCWVEFRKLVVSLNICTVFPIPRDISFRSGRNPGILLFTSREMAPFVLIQESNCYSLLTREIILLAIFLVPLSFRCRPF